MLLALPRATELILNLIESITVPTGTEVLLLEPGTDTPLQTLEPIGSPRLRCRSNLEK